MATLNAPATAPNVTGTVERLQMTLPTLARYTAVLHAPPPAWQAQTQQGPPSTRQPTSGGATNAFLSPITPKGGALAHTLVITTAMRAGGNGTIGRKPMSRAFRDPRQCSPALQGLMRDAPASRGPLLGSLTGSASGGVKCHDGCRAAGFWTRCPSPPPALALPH